MTVDSPVHRATDKIAEARKVEVGVSGMKSESDSGSAFGRYQYKNTLHGRRCLKARSVALQPALKR